MGLIQVILNLGYQILTLLIALPFKWINDTVETFGTIVGLFTGKQEDEEETEEVEIPQYPEPVEVKGFHHYNNEQTEETEDDLP